ncbi:MAG: o-succinylbenzoate synthase, partial [Cyanobacteria bacterium J06631_2]
GWQGVFVIKAAIMGFPSRLIQFCQNNALDFVFSSVLETDVARQTVLNLTQQLNHPRALGFGVQHLYVRTTS